MVPLLAWGIAGHILWAGSANLFLPVRPGHKQARTLQLHSSTQPLALSGCLPQRSFTVATFRALSMLARTLQLHSSTQPLGLPAASGHSVCSPAHYSFTLPPSPWACQPLPGTQHARPHFTASLFHSALGLTSRFRALSMLARTLQLHSSTQPLGLPATAQLRCGAFPRPGLQARTLQHSLFSTHASRLPK